MGRRFKRLQEKAVPTDSELITKIRRKLSSAPESRWINLTTAQERSKVRLGTIWQKLKLGLLPQFEVRKPSRDFKSGESPHSSFVHQSVITALERQKKFEEFIKENFYTREKGAKVVGLGSRNALKGHIQAGFPSVLLQRGKTTEFLIPKFLVDSEGNTVPLSEGVLRNWLDSQHTLNRSSTFREKTPYNAETSPKASPSILQAARLPKKKESVMRPQSQKVEVVQPKIEKIMLPPVKTGEAEEARRASAGKGDYFFYHQIRDFTGFSGFEVQRLIVKSGAETPGWIPNQTAVEKGIELYVLPKTLVHEGKEMALPDFLRSLDPNFVRRWIRK